MCGPRHDLDRSALSWERKTTNAICSFRMFLFDLLPESLRTRLYQAIPQLVPSFFPTRRLIQSLFILAPSTMCIILTPSAPGFPVGGCTGKSRSAPGNPGQLRGIPVGSGESWSAPGNPGQLREIPVGCGWYSLSRTVSNVCELWNSRQ